ncbi:MAG: ribosome maturation factor RimM [Bacilli bacterium]|nr:ribosome maturation factor RimM [Bacilli bacterium]
MEEHLQVGIIVDSFGLDGTIKIKSSTTKGEIRYKKGNELLLVNNDEIVCKLHVLSRRSNGMFDFVKFEEINSKEEALSKKGMEIQTLKDSSVLKKGEYFYSDLRGCQIVDNKTKNILGVVKEVEEFPAQITLRVKRENLTDFFVPFIKEFIVEVDIENKTILINVFEGML